MKYVSSDDLIGATITYVGWSTIEVLTVDGRPVEIRVEDGFSGVELGAYEISNSKTRQRRTDV